MLRTGLFTFTRCPPTVALAISCVLCSARTPVLITVGQHDELTPACALRMKLHLPDAELAVFPNSSHMPFYEEPEAYYPVLLRFLAKHRGR